MHFKCIMPKKWNMLLAKVACKVVIFVVGCVLSFYMFLVYMSLAKSCLQPVSQAKTHSLFPCLFLVILTNQSASQLTNIAQRDRCLVLSKDNIIFFRSFFNVSSCWALSVVRSIDFCMNASPRGAIFNVFFSSVFAAFFRYFRLKFFWAKIKKKLVLIFLCYIKKNISVFCLLKKYYLKIYIYISMKIIKVTSENSAN